MVKKNSTKLGLLGSEQEVQFQTAYSYFWVQNMGGSDVLMSMEPEIADGKDGVITVPAGSSVCTMHGYTAYKLYLLGTGTVQVMGTYSAHCPFKLAPKGGDEFTSSGGAITLGTVDYPLVGLNLYGHSVQNGTPTPDEPIDIVSVGDDGAVSVTACGKNLLPYPYFQSETSISGGTIMSNADGSLSFSGTPTGLAYIFLYEGSVPKSIKGDITLSLQGQFANVQIWVKLSDTNGNVLLNESTVTFLNFSVEEYPTATAMEIGVKRISDNVAMTGVGYPQLELGSTATSYEPYTGNTATITSGLPLCSVGEYRDELIYNADGTGKVIKRIRKVVLDGSEQNWIMYTTNNGYNRPSLNLGVDRCIYGNYTTSSPSLILCDKYKAVSYQEITNGVEGIGLHHVEGRYLSIYDENFATATIDEWKSHLADNPLTVIYVLNTPQEIELSTAEMAALQKLQTFDGITTIYNYEGAEMSVKTATNPLLSEYVKPVIDGITARFEARIAALEAAVTSNT